MNVEWSRLRILDAVARTGSVAQAAQQLHLTGPAVSQQLRRIETEAGVRVVTPQGRGVRLTREGRVLAEYAAEVSELMVRAERDLHQGEELIGRLRIGALASTIRTVLTQSLPAFQRRHPRVELCIEDGETAEHLSRLSTGSLDIAVAESWTPTPLHLPPGVTARCLLREDAGVAVPSGHPLQRREQVDIAELAHEPWTTCAQGSDGHRALTQVARERGAELDIRHFVADHRTQLALVRAGLAIACVPETATSPEETDIVFRPLSPAMHRDILLLTSSRTLSRPVAALVADLSESSRSTTLPASPRVPTTQ